MLCQDITDLSVTTTAAGEEEDPFEAARITRVRTKGFSCVDERNVPCIYANRDSNLSLTVENVGQHKPLSVAFTTDSWSFGQPCQVENLLLRVPLKFDGLPSAANTEVSINVHLNDSQDMETDYYICLNGSSGWMHQGLTSKVRVKNLVRSMDSVPAASIFGMRAEGDRTSVSSEGVIELMADTDVTLRMFGFNFTTASTVAFTQVPEMRGAFCENLDSKPFVVVADQLTDRSAKVIVNIAESGTGANYYICVKEQTSKDTFKWIHQGTAEGMVVAPQGRLLPLWLQIILICLLLTMSGLFSGLNLGLMALDRTELKIIQNTGTESEKKYAKAIAPIRKMGNYLLCTLLLGNVLVNSSLTILLDDLTSGLVAVIGSTLAIVIFGEILPQAICSRHGLAVGANTVWITKFFMLVTFPLSFPISKLLDLVLGEEIGNVYNRDRLKELIRVTNEYHDLQKDEVNIISGALELSKKTVTDVMTKLDDVFMLPYNTSLDFEAMSHIMKQGYTRIPIYEEERSNIIALLNIKDLAFVDPDDNTPLKTLCQFYNHPINFVFEDTTLAVMLDEFKKGQSHMAFVQHINTEGEGDPFYEVIGVVTLEDVIEEIIQSEIIDETDVVTDNRRKQKRKETHLKQDFSLFAEPSGSQGLQISPQMVLATYQYLSTAVDPFKPEHISETVLRRLMKQDIFYQIKIKSKESLVSPQAFIYQAGKPADYFVLILEGRAQVTIGKENLVFECGPFTFFGIQSLAQQTPLGEYSAANISTPGSNPSINAGSGALNTSSPDHGSKLSLVIFVPDYTVQAVQDLLYLCIKRTHYQAALRATMIERQHKIDPNVDDPFKQMDKFRSDSLERLTGSFRRTAADSTRSSARSFAELPALSSGAIRSGSIVSPLAAPITNYDPTGENVRNRAASQPEPTSYSYHEGNDLSSERPPPPTAMARNGTTAAKRYKPEQQQQQQYGNHSRPTNYVVDMPESTHTRNAQVQNGQVVHSHEESTL